MNPEEVTHTVQPTTLPAAPALPVKALLPALAIALLALVTIYLVQYDQGALSQSGRFLHELMHDGRHLLGVPCH